MLCTKFLSRIIYSLINFWPFIVYTYNIYIHVCIFDQPSIHYFCIIASDHLFNDASHLVTRSAAAITKLQVLEPKLMIYDEESRKQCLEVRNVVLDLNSVCVCMYVCVFGAAKCQTALSYLAV